MQHQPRVIEQFFARRRQFDAEPLAFQQRHPQRLLQMPDPRAGGGERQTCAARGARDVPGFRHRDEQIEIDKIEEPHRQTPFL
ncbi:hypothetical protein GCM10022626_17050 [[Pseudomonas] carboxydohydrogena]